ncbi:MAG: hypothetical protein K1000chlam3_01154 [Chlamydiae bacterium]|nr:hypothetical protein [Chlamydiota bacterium]
MCIFHICQNHPFIDGNKRVALVSAYVFLYCNDYLVEAPEEKYENIVRGVAEGKFRKEDIANFFKKNSKKWIE